jgi:hypothetical protein
MSFIVLTSFVTGACITANNIDNASSRVGNFAKASI